MKELYGLIRSLLLYYGPPYRLGRQMRFYSQFIQPGDLCFDIGAHAGSRIRPWLRLGAQIVAVEPQPLFASLLRRLNGHRKEVHLVEAALGAVSGQGSLLISKRTPTVTTLSPDWAVAVRRAHSFSWVKWDGTVPVQITTLNTLIDQFGEPVFCKIDVEGYELEVLKGLSRPLRCLSIEYIPATVGIAAGCIHNLDGLGIYEYNYTIGERLRFQLDRWESGEEIVRWLETLPVDDPTGDIYARRNET